MKKVATLLFVIVFLAFACETDKENNNNISTPIQQETPKPGDLKKPKTPAPSVKVDPIVAPKTYSKIGEAKGDLDKDGIDETAIVYNTARETDFGTEREIYVYKLENNKWNLWHKSIGAVLPSEHGGAMGDPFEEVTIERACLVFKHLGGSRQKWSYTHRFRHQNNSWELIGTTVVYGSPCDYWEDFDYNLSTSKVVFKKETENCEEGEEEAQTKTETREFKAKKEKLPKMDGFYPGNNEVAFPNSEKTFYY